ncbi:hypothetical protein OIV83_003455 [Microbotryomycetes sp. JL201]|nr:hypothetical protein OIV83_003455 [Microbotryomycetes sp. JL201]
MISHSNAKTLPHARPPAHKRTFRSTLVEKYIADAQTRIKDPDLRRLFVNCWTSTLDTTIFAHGADMREPDLAKARPETWVITGDINAMWLRDSANQVASLASTRMQSDSHDAGWTSLYRLLLGAVYAQASCILFHPYSNAFIPPTSTVQAENSDFVRPKVPSPPNKGKDNDGGIRVWESKWELDSLASFVDLSGKLIEATNRTDLILNPSWRKAFALVIDICRLQQRGTDEEVALLQTPWLGPEPKQTGVESDSISAEADKYKGRRGVYRFTRETRSGSETRPLNGLGEPARRCGLIKSAFRPSDDATVFQFLVPANAFMAQGLRRVAQLLEDASGLKSTLSDELVRSDVTSLAKAARALAEEVTQALWTHAIVEIANAGRKQNIFAYEVDGYGSALLADDANLPSLLSLPYMGFVKENDPVYLATREFVLSDRNKWFFRGTAGEGIGGMHVGHGFIWPMSVIMRAMTSDDDEEILDCLGMLKNTTAGTGLMHESFHKGDARNYTRSWFAWANGMFGQLIMRLLEERPHLLM